MAEEITLRAYIELIETMIRQGRMDEAIAHSAHVLQFYPKNAVVYRNLGRALMRLQRYEEASEIFRRLLAAMPDDFSAHYQLSIVYEQEKNGDAALWHIERAFDQQPNSAQVNDRLRDLYKKFKNVDVDKIQLTAGAVAIQYNKSGMYDEAISLLQRTLVKVPDRADLLTLLAMTQWKHGDVVDAAETALDVLKSYPYALEANRILSELWLQEERPSDAQRYLSRVEDIDPYLAYEIATDDDVPDSQFMVEELDFSKYAASLASQEQAPDWLSNIEELAEAELLASATETSLDELDSDAEDLDWLTELQEDSQPIVPQKKVTDDLSDLLPDDFNFPDSAGQDDTVDTGELSKLAKAENEDAFAELFGGFDDDEIEGTGLTGLLADDDDDLPRPAGRTTGLTGMLGKLGLDDDDKPETDDLSWLDEVSAGHYDTDNQTQSDDALTDMDVADDFFAEMEEGGDDDPLAWLETDNLISNEDDGDNAIHTAQLTEKANIDPNDPMAWLQDSGIEFDEDADDSSSFFVEDEPATIESDDLSPMAWLGEDIETDEPAYDTNEFNADADDALQEDPMAWLSDEGLEIDEFDDDDEDNEFGTNALTIQDEDDSLSWLTESGIELDDEPENVETPDTNDILTGQLASLNETSQEVEGDPMAWLAEGGVEFLDEPEFSSENEDEDDNWLDDDSVLDDLLNIADLTNTESNTPNDLFIETEMQDTMNDQPDWTPDDDFSSDDELDWLVNDESGDEVSFEAEADDDSMAWLEDNGIEIDDEPEDDFAFEAQTDDDSMAWLEDSGIEIDDEPEDDFALEAQADDDSMAWLEDSGIEIDDEPEDDFAFEAEADEDSLAWLEDNGIGIDDELEDDLPQPTGKTSLLNFLSDEHEEIEIDANIDNLTEAEAFAEEDVDWLRALDGEEIEDEEEISEGDTFAEDFSETSDAEVEWNLEQTSDGDDFDWGKDEPIEDEEELDWMAEPNAEVEDFFPDFDNGDTDDEPIAEPADADWLSELDEEPIAEDSDFPDFDDEDELDEFPEPAELDWLDDSEQQPVAETTDADWLSELGSGFTDELDEANAETQDEWAVGSGFTDELSDEDEDELPEPAELDWLDDSEQQPVAETADADWLSELGSGFTDELDEVNAETQDEWAVGSGFTDELSEDEDEFPEPAEADWLSELDDEPLAEDGDLSDFDELDDEDEFPEPAEADWLSELDEQPLAEDSDLSDFDEVDDEDEFLEPAEADWLSELDDEPLAEDGEEQPVTETAAADWLSELEDDSDDSIEEWSEDEEFEAEAVAEAWDNEEEVTDELIEPQPALETDEDNWLSGIGVQEADEWDEEDYDEYEDEYELNISSTTGMSDMLETIRSSREEDDDSPLQDFEQDEPDWLKQTGELISPVEEEEAIPMAEFEEFDDDEEFEALADDSFSDDEFEQDEFIQDEYQEELEQADADNAPDWLNAMVPGLDLDFEAEDEGHLDEGFESRENTLRERRVSESEIIKDDFDWLQDIVEEETGVMDAVSDEDMATTPPPTPLAPRKQYIFSSPPVWARDDSAKESIAQTVAMASEVPDYLSDFDEFEEVNEYDFDETLDDQFKFESEEIVTVDDEFDEFDNIEFTSVDDEFDEFGDDNAVIVDEPVQELQDEFDDTPLAVEDFDFNNDSTVKAKAIDDEFGEFEDALSAEDTGFDFDNAGTIIEDELDDALTVEDSDFDFDNANAVIDDEFEDTLSAEDTGFDFDNAGAIIEGELDDEFDEFDDFDDEFDEFDDFDDEFDD